MTIPASKSTLYHREVRAEREEAKHHPLLFSIRNSLSPQNFSRNEIAAEIGGYNKRALERALKELIRQGLIKSLDGGGYSVTEAGMELPEPFNEGFSR